MAPDVTRHFIEADGRLLHYARAGSGPPVVLLHGSPQTHRALLPLLERLAQRFTVLAFDTPGYGQSDPLPGRPRTLAPFADALVAALRALGLGPVPVYGTHTGAGIALEAANRHPDRITHAVLDGFSVFSDAEREDMLREYVPPYPPRWDGSHLTALWSRVRDQTVFFPWFRRGASARRPEGPPGLLAHHAMLLDLLQAGDAYAAAYSASIAHDPAALLASPGQVTVICRTDDLLFPHLDRLPAGFPRSHVRTLGADRDAWAAAVADLLEQGARGTAPPAPAAARRYVRAGGQEVHLRTSGLSSGRPLVLLHRHPGSSATIVTPDGRPVIAPDCPGSGQSSAAPGHDDPDAVADCLAAVLVAEGLDGFDLAGDFTGATLAAAVARRLGPKVHRLALLDPPPPDPVLAAGYPLDVSPRWDGGHALAAWFRHRDALLFRPWFDRRAAAALPLGWDVDLHALHLQAVATLEGATAGTALCRALLQRPPDTHAAACFPGFGPGFDGWLRQ